MSKFYKEYIKSDEWKNKREEIFLLKWRFCEKCKSKNNLVIHHGSYLSLWHEKEKHLFVLCNYCHSLFHKKYWIKDLYRATQSFIFWKEYIPKKKRIKMTKEERRMRRKERKSKLII